MPSPSDNQCHGLTPDQQRLCEGWCNQIVQILTKKNPQTEYFDTLCKDLRLKNNQIEFLKSYLIKSGNDYHHLSLSQDSKSNWLVQYYPNDYGPGNLYRVLNENPNASEKKRQTINLEVSLNQLTDFVYNLQSNRAEPAIALLNKLSCDGLVSTTEILIAYKQIHCPSKPLRLENDLKREFNEHNSLSIQLDDKIVTLSNIRTFKGTSWKLPDTHKSTAVITDNFTDYPTIKRLLISAKVFTNNKNYTKAQILSAISNGLPLTQPNFNPTVQEKALFKAFQAYVQERKNNKDLLNNIFKNIGFSPNNLDFDYNER